MLRFERAKEAWRVPPISERRQRVGRPGKEQHMEVSTGDYKSPKHAQVWFLFRSWRNWKKKYQELKTENKRMRNHVADVRRSREKWSQEAQRQRQRAAALEAENTLLREQLERGKKNRGAGV